MHKLFAPPPRFPVRVPLFWPPYVVSIWFPTTPCSSPLFGYYVWFILFDHPVWFLFVCFLDHSMWLQVWVCIALSPPPHGWAAIAWNHFCCFCTTPCGYKLGCVLYFLPWLSSPGLKPLCPCNRTIVVLFFRDPLLVLDNKRGCTIGCLVLFVGTGLAVNFPNRTIVGFVYCFTEALHLF